jgi:hypothetical protein
MQLLLQWKSINIIYYVCVFVVYVYNIQCPHAILSSVVSPAVQYFSTLSYKRQNFLHFIKHVMCN